MILKTERRLLLLLIVILFISIGCRKEISDDPRIIGQWRLEAIEDNNGNVIETNPFGLLASSSFQESGRYKLDLHSGTYVIYEGQGCDFNPETMYLFGTNDVQEKWTKKVLRIHSRASKYEIEGDTLRIIGMFRSLKLFRR